MQWCITPAKIEFFTERFKFCQVLFGDGFRFTHVIHITEINSASQRAMFAGSAELVNLEWAEAGICWSIIGRSTAEQNISLQMRQEQSVAILGKATTFSTGQTDRAVCTNLCVGRVIEPEHPGSEFMTFFFG